MESSRRTSDPSLHVERNRLMLKHGNDQRSHCVPLFQYPNCAAYILWLGWFQRELNRWPPVHALLATPSTTSWRWIIQLPRGVRGPVSGVRDPAEVRVIPQPSQSAFHVFWLQPDSSNGRWSQACLVGGRRLSAQTPTSAGTQGVEEVYFLKSWSSNLFWLHLFFRCLDKKPKTRHHNAPSLGNNVVERSNFISKAKSKMLTTFL